MAIELPEGWVKDAEWYGNPALGFESYSKHFQGGRSVIRGAGSGTVIIYGTPNPIESGWKDHPYLGYSYVVKGSHSGAFRKGKVVDILEAIALVELSFSQGTLFW